CSPHRLPPPPRYTLFPYTTLFRSDEGLDVPLPAAQELVAHEPEPPRKAEHPPAMVQAEIEGEPREAVVRAGEVEEAVAHHPVYRSEEHTSELQSLRHLVCRLLLEK